MRAPLVRSCLTDFVAWRCSTGDEELLEQLQQDEQMGYQIKI